MFGGKGSSWECGECIQPTPSVVLSYSYLLRHHQLLGYPVPLHIPWESWTQSITVQTHNITTRMCTHTEDMFVFKPKSSFLKATCRSLYLLAVSVVSGKDQNMAANTILLLCTYGGYWLLAEGGRRSYEWEHKMTGNVCCFVVMCVSVMTWWMRITELFVSTNMDRRRQRKHIIIIWACDIPMCSSYD